MTGTRIRELRKKHRYSQKQLAEKLGVAQTAVSGWEIGTRSISLEMLQKIALVLQEPINCFFDDAFTFETIDQKAQDLAKAFPLSGDFREDTAAYRDDVYEDTADGEFYNTFMAAKEKSECVLLEETKSISDAQIRKELYDVFSQINRKGKVLLYKYAFELSISGEYMEED